MAKIKPLKSSTYNSTYKIIRKKGYIKLIIHPS
jgi:hypothetical protein